MDLFRAIVLLAGWIYLCYNIAVSWIRLDERQLGSTEKNENAQAQLFPSVTMCPIVNVTDETIMSAMAIMNSQSAELWFDNISNHSSKLLRLKHTFLKEGRITDITFNNSNIDSNILEFHNVRRSAISNFKLIPKIDQLDVCITYNPQGPTYTGMYKENLVSYMTVQGSAKKWSPCC